MSVIDTLITDRSAADYQLWQTLKALGWSGMSSEQQAQWVAGLKGAYNASDLNRVQEAMEYLAGVFSSYGYTVSLQVMPTWSDSDIPTEAQMTAYLSNLAALRGVLAVLPTTPATPESMELLTYVEANNIEQILVDINQLLENMAASWFYSGEVYCGEVS